jgi:hypothetical protein
MLNLSKLQSIGTRGTPFGQRNMGNLILWRASALCMLSRAFTSVKCIMI